MNAEEQEESALLVCETEGEGERERERAIHFAPTASLWTCALIWPLSMAPSAKGLSRRALSMEQSTVGLVVFHMGPKNNRQYLVLSIFSELYTGLNATSFAL